MPGPSKQTGYSSEGSTQLAAGNPSTTGFALDPLPESPEDLHEHREQPQPSHEASLGAVSPDAPRSKAWHAVNAAAALPFAPAGMLELFLGDAPLSSRLDGRGWSALHHAAAVGDAERMADAGREELDGVSDASSDDDERHDEPACVGKVRRLVLREPGLCRLSDPATFRLPIHVAAAGGLPIEAIEILCREWPSALLRRDGREGLCPALLAAASGATTIDCVYRLLLASPQVLHRHR